MYIRTQQIFLVDLTKTLENMYEKILEEHALDVSIQS